MVASRTALIVGGITLPTGLIMTIVGAAYYGDSYSTCNSGTDAAKKAVDATSNAASTLWCKMQMRDIIYSGPAAAIELADIYVKNSSDVGVPIENAATGSGESDSFLTDVTCGNLFGCDMLNDQCELKAELHGKLYTSTAADTPLQYFNIDGTPIPSAAARQLQTSLRGPSRKLTGFGDLANSVTDAANTACDADFAAMIAMCVIGGILMVVGFVFFAIWFKCSSDADRN